MPRMKVLVTFTYFERGAPLAEGILTTEAAVALWDSDSETSQVDTLG
jgi:hypothetical protein